MKTKRNGLYFGIIAFGLVGQIAWVIENMYLNVFLYKTVTYDLTATSVMVAMSAIVATLTTLFIGVFSDKIGKRKQIISVGYIIWGLSVMSFSLVSVKNLEGAFPGGSAVKAATVIIILLDCIMTFFGSSANDAAFNAWVTDNTNVKNRGRTEGVLQIMPLIALLLVFGALDSLTKEGKWSTFFVVVGLLTTAVGVLGIFMVKDSASLAPKKTAYFKDIFYGFKPSTVKENKTLYLIFGTIMLVCIGNNSFMPYLMIYIEYFLGFSDYVLLLGGVLLGASAVSVVFGIIADRIDKRILFIPAFLLYIGGGLGMTYARSMVAVGFAGFALMAGNLSLLALLSSLMRNHTPPKEAGLFQGIRMVFMVLVPMCIGPFIGAFVSSTSNAIYVDPTTLQQQPVPSNFIFTAAIVVTAIALIPVLFMCLHQKGKWLKNAPFEDKDGKTDELGTFDIITEQAESSAQNAPSNVETSDRNTNDIS